MWLSAWKLNEKCIIAFPFTVSSPFFPLLLPSPCDTRGPALMALCLNALMPHEAGFLSYWSHHLQLDQSSAFALMIEAATLGPIYVTISGENEQPYFLLGSPSENVGIWKWVSKTIRPLLKRKAKSFSCHLGHGRYQGRKLTFGACPDNCFYFTKVHRCDHMNHYRHQYDCSLPPTTGLACVLQRIGELCVNVTLERY